MQQIHRNSGRSLILSVAIVALVPVLADAQRVPGIGRGTAESGGVLRHNPIFGLGPQTIWRGGFGVALEGQLTQRTGTLEERGRGLHGELLYGITQDVNLALAFPLGQSRTVRGLAPGGAQIDRDATGLGDAVIRAKWRFYHSFSGRTQYHAAIIGGVKVPLATASGDPPLGSGSTDFLGAATVSRDGLRSYLWLSGLVRVNGEAFGRQLGNEYRYDAAVGLRPWIPSFRGIDPLLLVEFNGVTAARTVVDGVARSASGGTILAISPGFWLTYRNWALKGGIKLPVLHRLRGNQPEMDYTVVLSIETHM